MSGRWCFTILTLLALTMGAMLIGQLPAPLWLRCGLAALTLLVLWLLYRATVKPIATVVNGMDLIQAQDTSNRLRRVGQHDADKVVKLFNRLMSELKTERLKGQEQALFTRLVIEKSPVGIALFDFDGRLTEANATFVHALDRTAPDELRGLTIEEIDHPLARRMAQVAVDNGGQTLRMGGDGAAMWRCYRLWFMERGFKRPFIMLERLTAEIVAAEKNAYGRAIRTLSHEVNNTMGGVLPLLEMVRNDCAATDGDMADALDVSIQRCQAMAQFITAYADVVKLPKPTMQRGDLCALVSGMSPFLESLIAHRCELRVHLASSPATALFDPVQMEHVLTNIVKNSAESIVAAGQSNGTIEIHATAEPTSLVITDNGGGIADDVAANLFTPFFTTKPTGHGLGLMTVGETLRNHGCRFTLATSPTDGLTRFTIAFPPCHPKEGAQPSTTQ